MKAPLLTPAITLPATMARISFAVGIPVRRGCRLPLPGVIQVQLDGERNWRKRFASGRHEAGGALVIATDMNTSVDRRAAEGATSLDFITGSCT